MNPMGTWASRATAYRHNAYPKKANGTFAGVATTVPMKRNAPTTLHCDGSSWTLLSAWTYRPCAWPPLSVTPGPG